MKFVNFYIHAFVVFGGGGQSALLKKIHKRKRKSAERLSLTVFIFCLSKRIVSVHKYFQYGSKSLKHSGKASAAPCKDWNIVP